MGAFGDMGAGTGKAEAGAMNMIGGFRDRARARQAMRDAQREKAAQLEAEKSIDWTPSYQSDLLGPYEGTKSPAARAYLQSFMTGDNPLLGNASTELPGAGKQRQADFTNRFGSPDDLLAQDRSARSQTYEAGTPGEVTNYIQNYEQPNIGSDDLNFLDKLFNRK